MKAAIDYKKANSELTGVDTFESILSYIVATVISKRIFKLMKGAGRYMNEFDYMEV